MISINKKTIPQLLPYVSEGLRKALEYIEKADFASMLNGEYEVDGREVFARVNSYNTEPAEAKKPERHYEYIDVQYLVSGSERIGYCPLTEAFRVVEDNSLKNDVVFYEQTFGENFIVLQEGDVAIFFPWEVHRPGCNSGAVSANVKKVVVKVRAL